MNFRNLFKISSSSVLRLTHGIFCQISNVTILEMIRGDWLKAQWCQIAWLHQSGVTENSFWPKSIEKLRGIKNSAKPQIALHGLVIQLRRVCAKSWVFSQEGPRTPLWQAAASILGAPTYVYAQCACAVCTRQLSVCIFLCKCRHSMAFAFGWRRSVTLFVYCCPL